MNNVIKDWIPETTDLLNALLAAGFAILSGEHEYAFKFRDVAQMAARLTECDESRLWVRKGGGVYGLLLVYGNSPGELVADYSLPRGVDLLEPVIEAHYNKWIELDQPIRAGGV